MCVYLVLPLVAEAEGELTNGGNSVGSEVWRRYLSLLSKQEVVLPLIKNKSRNIHEHAFTQVQIYKFMYAHQICKTHTYIYIHIDR